ncbi:C40 family peptidase [Romboutsia lituseburensis]|uniref:Cell wall-associated hydrolase, NlpC family n=1 Tax=Romboutsia lituseburensis DSM 797 TaxID=1121325 RepID=A0A1G9KXR7_9FIRM|nr:SH3 domain-containing protein [Romboutsia lituseburensis]CEH35068.1 SH3 domain protein [Romboutsia lituseburensis]SDL54419.1 Cell wall-associated hydrolase, NlpC family [Romboutsia lituseburensis DSM 797]
MVDKKVAVALCATTIGFAMASTDSFANEKQGIITVSALNIRSGPSTSYSVVTKAYKGEKVEILESSDGWHKVKLSNGNIGWGSSSYINLDGNLGSVAPETPSTGKKATITTSSLNIRSGPSTSYSVVTKAYKGEKVEILENSSGWYKVKLSNGKVGWGSGSYISLDGDSGQIDQERPVNPEVPSTGKEGVITTSSLNIRSGPSTSYSIITKVSKGETVEILESSNGWYKVKLSNGKVGWGSGSYITVGGNSGSTNPENPTNPETPSIGKKGKITTSSLNIRSGPSTSYAVITKASKGESVDVIESSSGWYKVKLSNGKIGWGSSSYISLNGESSDNTNNGNSSNNGSSENNGNGSESVPQDKAQAIIDIAKAQIGKPYVWGAEGPDTFDCSGLTYYVYGKVGIKLPRVSRDQYSVGTYVNRSNLQPGDLLFSSTDGSGNITHVGIYIGNGEMIHSPKPGSNVQITNINSSYWQNAHVGAKRVI